jgi:hypothetical protein
MQEQVSKESLQTINNFDCDKIAAEEPQKLSDLQSLIFIAFLTYEALCVCREDDVDSRVRGPFFSVQWVKPLPLTLFVPGITPLVRDPISSVQWIKPWQSALRFAGFSFPALCAQARNARK